MIETRYGIERRQFAFIDDRLDNLRDLLSKGIGMAMHAPTGVGADSLSLTSFDFGQVAGLLQSWDCGNSMLGLHRLDQCDVPIQPWHRTGLNTQRQSRSLFNAAQLSARLARRLLLPSQVGH